MSILFVSAQPDVEYFHWQCEIYLNNFISHGINPDDIHVLFAITQGNNKPSEGALKLKTYTPNIHFYHDTRDKKHYIPSIKPFLINKWLKEDPTRGDCFFLHDSDIIFLNPPKLDLLTNDNLNYCSNTKGYIGYEYIMDCGRRYGSKHNINESLLLNEMCFTIGVEPYIVENNERNSGGAQYLLKNQTEQMWFKMYKDSNRLYDVLVNFQKKYPIHPGEIQFWTAEMWSILWNLWYWGYRTEITPILDFCWASDDIGKTKNVDILHMAGVTENDKTNKFFKGDFINVNPLELLKNENTYFNYVDNKSTTVIYIKEMMKLIKK